MRNRWPHFFGLMLCTILFSCGSQQTPNDSSAVVDESQFEGRWNITEESDSHVSWLEIMRDGRGWKGRYLHRWAHPQAAGIEISNGTLRVTMLPENDRQKNLPALTGRLEGDRLVGTGTSWDGSEIRWTGVRAPDRLEGSDRQVEWGEPIELFNGKNTEGWEPIGNAENNWKAQDGMLVNSKTGANLRTVEEFRDFRLHLEWKIPKGSNSGIYLRGRYETQVADTYGIEPHSRAVGGIYGMITPSVNAVKPAGEWNTVDVTLIGYRVTVVINGETTIDGQLIDGITGGALDADEAAPGPIMLQGDHGVVHYRNIVLTPAL